MDSQQLLGLGQFGSTLINLMIAVGVCSLRLFVVFVIIPPTGEQALQGVVRNGVVLLFGSFVAFGQAEGIRQLQATSLVLIAAKEVSIGVVLGFLASTVFWVAENVGLMIDDLSGYNNVQVSNPQRSDSATPTSILLSQLAIACFWVLGGMTFLLGAVYQSFQWLPIAQFALVPSHLLEAFVVSQTDTLMQTSAKIATPIMLVLVLIDLAFGFVAKGAEHLEPMELSQPVKGAVTVLLLAVFVSVFADQVRNELSLANVSAQLSQWVGMAGAIAPSH